MKPIAFLAAALLFAPVAQATSPDMVELPVNTKIRAMTYLYCVTGDDAAIADLLAQRLVQSGGFTDADAAPFATDWLNSQYCSEQIAAADQAYPALRAEVTALLEQDGYSASRPITAQAASKSGGKGGFLKRIGKIINGVAAILTAGASAQGQGHYTYHETGEKASCDRSWSVTVGSGGEGYRPTPYYPPQG
jgi:hypothetical protein